MTPDQVDRSLSFAAEQGCFEALVCLGDTPETAFPAYRKTLAAFGHDRTVEYIEWACERALSRGLLPHTNAGILTQIDMRRLKSSNASLGLMLENVSTRLCGKGMPHHRAPDKRPAVRLQMLEEAGKLAIPFTTGILVGIGESALERVEALLAIARLHLRYGHIQEVIVQNFTPHEGTPMSSRETLRDWEVAHAIALARLILPDDVSVQAPPNLNAERTALLVESGINDFGGISPVTVDYINPDRPWPQVTALSRTVSALGFELSPRLSVYDAYVDRPGFLEPALRTAVGDAKRRLAANAEVRAPWRDSSGMPRGADVS